LIDGTIKEFQIAAAVENLKKVRLKPSHNFSGGVSMQRSCWTRPSTQRNISQRGFTLIELLVVIAIISLLAAILFPVFARARENARRASCQSNMKQLGLGIAQYLQDYDGTFPAGLGYTYGGPDTLFDYSGAGWAEKIYPYVKNAQVYVCPDEDLKAKMDWAPGANRVSYGINGNLACPRGSSYRKYTLPSIPPIGKESALNAPAKTVMLFEAALGAAYITTTMPAGGSTGHGFGSPAGWGDVQIFSQYSTDGGFYATGAMGGYHGATFTSNQQSVAASQHGHFSTTGRHFDGANFLMADGHVKFLMGDRVSIGNAASSPIAAQSTTPSYPDYYSAEGTEYSSSDAHVVTFSTK
jgi:prepilin-type N-terminal cleavage/methylation domain-containing protein/prepilin-type processing-associated H-X9-DG protein